MSQDNYEIPDSLGDVSGTMYKPVQAEQVQGVTEPAYEIESTDNAQPDYAMAFISLAVVLFLFLLFKPCRDFAIWVLKDLAMPALTWFLQIGSLWMVWLFRNIVVSHIDFTKHLMTPRTLVYYNLDDQREENDKSINRKLGQ